MKKIVSLFTSCRIVKGYRRGGIYDLGRNKFHLVPIELCDFIHDIIGISLAKFNRLKNEDKYREYANFIQNKELIFFANEDEFNRFPPLKIEYCTPSLFNTAVIQVENEILFSLHKFLLNIQNLGCENVVFISINSMSAKWLIDILHLFKNSRINQVEFVFKYYDEAMTEPFFDLFHLEPRLRKVSLHTAPENNIHYIGGESSRVFTFKQPLNCFPSPLVDFGYFKVNVPFFMEASLFNPFYNQKIFINQGGFLQNHPYSTKNFGHIDEVSLERAISEPSFQDIWHFKKDDIEVCKHCEFRYMCFDCRIPLTVNNRSFHETECNYNPYICKWEGEAGFKNLDECGISQNAEIFEINDAKLDEIFKKLNSHV